jgi:pilus assembly protein FimV
MITRTFTSLAVMAAIGVMTPFSNSHAFGLGKIELSSALNQPFKAQIPITAVREEEKGNIQVQLASASEFQRAGLERNYYLTQFEFNIVEKNGQYAIDISSKQAVKEPYLALLLTATAGSGRLIREYTVLLDPPKDIFVKPQQQAKQVKTTTTVPVSTQKSAYTAPKYKADGTYGPTDRNDTLWKIAAKTKPNDASVNQMMMALLDSNPEAFSNNNINGLKAGHSLTLPSESEITKRSKSQAIADVSQQNTLWKNRNAKPTPVAAPVEKPATVEQPVKSQTQQTEIKTPIKENEVVRSETETTSQLKLVAPSNEVVTDETEMSPMGDDKLTSLTEQLTLAQETIENQTQENIDIKARMTMMEEQIETLRRLLSLKDPDLALMQSSLEKQAQAEITAAESLADNQTTDSNVDNPDQQSTPSQNDVSEKAESELNQGTDTQATPANVEGTTSDAADIAVQTQETIDSALESVDGAVNYISDLAGMDQNEVKSHYEQAKAYISNNKEISALGGLGLLLVIWVIIRLRNRPYVAWEDAVQDKKSKLSVDDADEKDSAVEEIEDVSTPNEVEIEPVKTVEQLVSDADVYVSYGDFAKAKQCLQAAYDDEPKNEEVIHKLLFVLYKQSQVNEFVTLAKYYQSETSATEWDDVSTWGQQLDSNEVLFKPVVQETKIEPAEIEQLPVETLDVDTTSTEELKISAVDDANIELNTFDVNASQQKDESTSEISKDEDRLTLPEIDTIDIEQFETLDEPTPERGNNVVEFDLDINNDDADFELTDLEAITDDDLSDANDALSGSELEFDLGDFDQVDEAETKLDLAAAYIDMGDPAGAKSILEEVLVEGNDDQKARAETMLSGLK